MSLILSANDKFFEFLQDLIRRVNEHVKLKDYAIVFLRIKKSKLEVTRKAWLICDRDRKTTESHEQERRHDTSRHIKCLFFLIVKKEDEIWFLKMINAKHNHFISLAKAHSVLRRMTMNVEMKSEISWQLTIQIFTFKIFLSH